MYVKSKVFLVLALSVDLCLIKSKYMVLKYYFATHESPPRKQYSIKSLKTSKVTSEKYIIHLSTSNIQIFLKLKLIIWTELDAVCHLQSNLSKSTQGVSAKYIQSMKVKECISVFQGF